MGVLSKLFEKHDISDSLSLNLTKPVSMKGQERTQFDRGYYRAGVYHQMDLLFLPQDENGSKYLLVVVDIGSGATDARPLKDKTGVGVLKAVKSIYSKHKYLSEPRYVHVDAGNEFNDTRHYLHEENIGVRVASVGRHSQQAIVEHMNKEIGSAILKLQTHNEILLGQPDRDWVAYLDDILKLINEHAKQTKLPLPIQDDEADAKCQGSECDILDEGTQVRVKLDYPIDIYNSRLHGKFRSGDIRWSLKPHTISKVLIFPNQPVRYCVEGVNNNTFSKAELMLYHVPKGMKLTKQFYIVEKIVGKRKVKQLIEYLVKWKGYDESQNTYEPKANLLKNASKLIDLYENGTK